MSKQVCGGNFPTSCGFAKETLYTCNAIGGNPVLAKACTRSCKYTLPDNSCRYDCDPPIQILRDKLAKVVIDTKSPSDLLTQLAYPPLVPEFHRSMIGINDAQFRAHVPTMALAAGSLNNTITGLISVFERIDEISTANNAAAVILDMQDLLPVIAELIQCSGVGGDCSGPENLFAEYMSSGLAKIAAMIVPPLDATKMNGIISQATVASNAIKNSISSKNSTLIEASLTDLNRLIGTTGLDHNTYGESVYPLELILAAANAWLTCEGKAKETTIRQLTLHSFSFSRHI